MSKVGRPVAARRGRSPRPDLPPGASFTAVEGGTHAQFGAYGLQPGDGTATISDDEARRLISAASLRFVDTLRP